MYIYLPICHTPTNSGWDKSGKVLNLDNSSGQIRVLILYKEENVLRIII
jgi:hypothetical protein